MRAEGASLRLYEPDSIVLRRPRGSIEGGRGRGRDGGRPGAWETGFTPNALRNQGAAAGQEVTCLGQMAEARPKRLCFFFYGFKKANV